MTTSATPAAMILAPLGATLLQLGVAAPMYIANPLSGGQMSALFSTHPPVAERVRRLRAYDRKRASGSIPTRAPAAGIS